MRLLSGLIPAHAGKTASGWPRRKGLRAHPRSRGENTGLGGEVAEVGGSSPLTRGKPDTLLGRHLHPGLIPAHAGKTRRSRRISPSSGAHPRSRGENLRLYGLGALNEGSSPLTRGKHVESDVDFHCPGLIPAHAGKTFQAELEMIQERAHPRSRGENDGAALPEWVLEGSSPLTRGKHFLTCAFIA